MSDWGWLDILNIGWRLLWMIPLLICIAALAVVQGIAQLDFDGFEAVINDVWGIL